MISVARQLKDQLSAKLMLLLTLLCVLLPAIILWRLLAHSLPLMQQTAPAQLFSGNWNPARAEFGFLPFLAGTLWVVGGALLIATPLSALSAIFLSEYAPPRLQSFFRPLLDLLAGIPSVVYGVWGVLAIVPMTRKLAVFFGHSFASGYCVLSAAIVLAIMIIPLITSLSIEALGFVSRETREASLALGATKWDTVKRVVLRQALPGIFAANMLGLARAIGETMAVLMVAGNIVRVPRSPLDPAYPLPALIANNFGEMLSIPLYDAALFFAALLLFVVALGFTLFSRRAMRQVAHGIPF